MLRMKLTLDNNLEDSAKNLFVLMQQQINLFVSKDNGVDFNTSNKISLNFSNKDVDILFFFVVVFSNRTVDTWLLKAVIPSLTAYQSVVPYESITVDIRSSLMFDLHPGSLFILD